MGLSVRAAIFRGRTNSIKLHHKVSGDEKINCLDFKSLYPFCQKVCKFPVSKSVYKTENFDNVDIWECDYDKLPDKIDEEISLGLSVRAAIFGNRTNAIELHHKVSGDEKIHW